MNPLKTCPSDKGSDICASFRIVLRVWFLLMLFGISAAGQDYRHLNQLHTPKSYSTLEDWLGRAHELREHILVSTSLWPPPTKTPLNPVLGQPIRKDGYSVQSVVLETLPGFYLTGSLYLPLDGTAPFPAVLSPHGHWSNGRLENTLKASVPGRAINFVLQGYVVLTYSMIGYNETAEVLPHRFENPQQELWGFGAMGLQLWNSIRALDFLTSRDEVDVKRIGLTGASGGATQAFMLTAIDPRIRVAAPVNMISAHFQGGCICENAPLLRLHTSNIEIAALAAPRPLLMVSTSGDWTKDTPEIEFPAIRSIYKLFSATHQVSNIHLNYEHNYNQESREAVYSWFSRWLLNRDRVLNERTFQVEEDTAMTAQFPNSPLDLEELFKQFTQRSQRQIEEAKPNNWSEIYSYRQHFGVALKHILEPSAYTTPHMEELRPGGITEAAPAVLVVYPKGSSLSLEDRQLIEDYRRKNWLVFLLRPPATDDSFSPSQEVRYRSTYNATFASQRINEIRIAGTELLAQPEIHRLDLIGLQEAGPWVLMARATMSEVDRTVVDFNTAAWESDEAYLANFFVPLVRRAGDFRTAAVMIVPADLTLRNTEKSPLRSWFKQVYKAAGAAKLLHLE